MRLIYADNAFEVLTDYYHLRTDIQRQALVEALERVPTIEVEPVKHGRWIKHLFEREWDICSYCKTGTKRREYGVTDEGKEWVTEYGYKYCPWCGAKMEEQE